MSTNRRGRRRRGRAALSEINVTPLVDVMLVLLIIFMVAAPIVHTGVPVSLPKAEAQAVPDDEGKLILTVPGAFTKDHLVYLGTVAIPFAELGVKLGANERIKSDHELYLHADRNLKYDDVVQVMAVVSKAGVEHLGLITDPLSNANDSAEP
jgi:biopolymer transport protein TolR